ncbi:MAG TPA: acyclic terpene utilization AtuA family protein [Solirubrobacteraceae bacterium]|nr:acyclic terpene utilization AtuA family protein [Solirubrobacteraceae bacterium]
MNYVAASGALGSGVDRASLWAALEERPAFIAADAGTTDAGAFALGSGETAFSRAAVKLDLAAVLEAGIRAGVPVIIGSAGPAGADGHVDWVLEIAAEVAAEIEERVRTFAIYSEQSTEMLEAQLRAGRIRALRHASELTAEDVGRCERVVAMMGVEPLQDALAHGAQLIVAGRCSDAALFAALPLQHGFPAGLAWHAGKVVECGTLACETMGPGVMLVTVREDSFSVRPIGEDLRCTPQSVAAHSLYETANPFLFAEPSGTLDIANATYEAETATSVRVRGSQFHPAGEYSVKLEGAELIGYRTMLVGGVRDPLILRQLGDWLERVNAYTKASILKTTGISLDDDRYRVRFQVYGRDAVMGHLEHAAFAGHEVGVVCTTLAPTQGEATEMARLYRQPLLHAPIPEWKGSITAFAYLHNPPWTELGPAYRFCLNHVLLLDEPQAVHTLRLVELGMSDGRLSAVSEATT